MYDIKKAQEHLLEIAVATTQILEKHDIPYMLALGTLLGAVRHNGFIPWDDDFDLFLFDDSYSSAIKILKQELPDKFFVEDDNTEPLYFHDWAHVKSLKSVAQCSRFPDDGKYKNKGLYIDLYRLKKIKLYDLNDWLIQQNKDYLTRKLKNGFISIKQYNMKLNTFNNINRSKNINNRYVYGFVSLYEKKYLEIKDVHPLKKICFERKGFFVPNKEIKILKEIYGDYLTLPPKEKRIPHFDYVEIL